VSAAATTIITTTTSENLTPTQLQLEVLAQSEVEETFSSSEDEAPVPPVAQDLTGAF
jgi:hypothetical protein